MIAMLGSVVISSWLLNCSINLYGSSFMFALFVEIQACCHVMPPGRFRHQTTSKLGGPSRPHSLTQLNDHIFPHIVSGLSVKKLAKWLLALFLALPGKSFAVNSSLLLLHTERQCEQANDESSD